MAKSGQRHGIRFKIIWLLIAAFVSIAAGFWTAEYGMKALDSWQRNRTGEVFELGRREINAAGLTDVKAAEGVYTSLAADASIEISGFGDSFVRYLAVETDSSENKDFKMRAYVRTSEETEYRPDTERVSYVHPGENTVYFCIQQNVSSVRLEIPERGVRFKINSVRNLYPEEAGADKNVYPVRVLLAAMLVFFIFLIVILTPKKVFSFLFKYRYPAGAAVVIFACVLELSGSSISQLNQYYPTDQTDIVFGSLPEWRSDEWGIFTQLNFSQARGTHPYSQFSDILRAEPTDTSMVYGLPSLSLGTVFRPFLIGYMLLGPVRGLSFYWSARIVVLVLASLELCLLLTDGRRSLSAAGAALISFSPVVAWWYSINGLVEMLIAGSYFIVLFDRFITGKKRGRRIADLCGMVLCGGMYIMTLYPAWMVPLGYVYGALFIWVILKDRKQIRVNLFNVISLIAAAAVLGAAMLFIFSKSLDTVEAVRNTVYPGKRLETGGSHWQQIYIYAMNFLYPFMKSGVTFAYPEEATFYSMFPLAPVLAAIALFKKGRRKKTDPFIIIGLAVAAFLYVYVMRGFPAGLAKVTLLSNCQASRAQIGLDLLQVLIILRSAAVIDEFSGSTGKIRGIVGASVAAVCVFLVGRYIVNTLRIYTFSYINTRQRQLMIFIVLFVICMLVIYFRKMPRIAAAVIAVLSMVMSLTVNPIRLGTGNYYTSELAQAVDSITEADPDAVWLGAMVPEWPLENYLAAHGARVINSTNTYPDLERWAEIDSSEEAENAYNRYAASIYITDITDRRSADEPAFVSNSPDSFDAHLTWDEVKKLGVKYLFTHTRLTGPEDGSFGLKEITHIENGSFYIYEIEV